MDHLTHARGGVGLGISYRALVKIRRIHTLQHFLNFSDCLYQSLRFSKSLPPEKPLLVLSTQLD